MTIISKTAADGAIKCKTVIDGRKYKSKYVECDEREARKRFRRRVVAAERKRMEEKRKELIGVCLNCNVPVAKCKGTCKLNQT